MRLKQKIPFKLITILLLSILVVVSCSPIPVNAEDGTTYLPNVGYGLVVSSPEMARNTSLEYLHTNNQTVPLTDVNWERTNVTSGLAVATSTFLYSYKDWTVSVVSPSIADQNKVFSVIVINKAQGFTWAGLIDAYGNLIKMGRLKPIQALPTTTPIPTQVPSAVPTFPPIATNTPVPATATPSPEPCNDATFIEDVTIPDGSVFTPGTAFLKIWRLKNVGTCTWTTSYDLVYVGGDQLGAQRAVSLAKSVRPGETIDVGVRMFAPQDQGVYKGYWMLNNTKGKLFGIGDHANASFWVSIKVVTNVSNYKFDFATNYCSGSWTSSTSRLRCNDTTSPQNGSVQFLINPKLENRLENEPTIWVHPAQTRNGWIEGSYPSIFVQKGDTFNAWVGCLAGNKLCDVTFYLSYIDTENHMHSLGSWRETYDGKVTKINLSLDALANQNMQFILGMKINNDQYNDAQGFWFVPRIEGN